VKAIFLVRKGKPENAFDLREIPVPAHKPNEVLIKVEAFGLNFADLVAREGMYRDAPPRPFVPGYDVVGTIEQTGADVNHLKAGDRVTAMTRFGGYAQYAVTDARAAVKISSSVNVTEACALTTQYCTAYYCAAVAANLHKGERVIVHTASGGVGKALMQYARHMECEVIATTGSEEKINSLLQSGAMKVINTSKENFYETVKSIYLEDGVDVIFDAMGGKFVSQGIKLLSAGGKIVTYGASQMTGTGIFKKLKAALQFGIYHPAQFMMTSKSLLGVNMLKIADERPLMLQHCLEEVMKLYTAGVFVPTEGKIFKAEDITAAHRFLQERKAIGKVVLKW
jgi:NADPH:quinone reductase-like Zn-dependent oxidoreductase